MRITNASPISAPLAQLDAAIAAITAQIEALAGRQSTPVQVPEVLPYSVEDDTELSDVLMLVILYCRKACKYS